MLNFTPMTADECENALVPLPKGKYHFTTIKSEQTNSKGGNLMLVLTQEIHEPRKNLTIHIKDYLLIDHPQMKYRFRHYCESINYIKEYEDGKIQLNVLEGKWGYAL